MAQTTRTLSVSKWGYVRSANPGTHYAPASGTWYYLSDGTSGHNARMLLALSALPSSLKHNKLYGIRFYFQFRIGAGFLDDVELYSNTADFNASTVTWNSKPGTSLAFYAAREFDRYGKTQVTGDYYVPSSYSNAAEAYNALNAVGFSLLTQADEKLDVRTILSSGATAYAVLSYDDTAKVLSRISRTGGPTNTTVDPRTAQTFSWDYVKADTSTYCMTPSWTQQSAVFYWKRSTENSYRSVAISGNTKQVTIPANTFPTGATIQYYIAGTDEEGTTTQTSVLSFSTVSSQLTADGFPSGTKVDTRYAIPFTWHFQSSAGNYPQSSARLYWRVQGASSWNSIAASGATQSLSVPANTFPTGRVIEWYLYGTDAGGSSSSTEVKTFTTVSSTIKPSTYPSGSNVYTGGTLTFTWYFDSSVGNYPQNSATFYWRREGENSYHPITVSGNTQRLDVPANTFPTGATVQWYLSGTDSGGTTTQTSSQSFKTLASKITVQDSPTSGYMDPRNAITFRWYYSTASGSIPQSSARFFWKLDTAGTYNTLTVAGGTTQITIAANTFPVAATIQWYVTGTDVGGTTSTSPVYSFSTAAGTAYAYAQSPIGTAEDGSKPITLRWTLYNADGSDPARVNLSWKQPIDTDWTTILDSSAPVREHTVAADFFPVGEIEWKIIATNRDGIDGPASTAAFICLRSPDPPSGLRATAVPITTINWQATGQEAYEISIDGSIVSKAYGPGISSWTVPSPIPDGIHTVSVRVQGPYGFWSEPSVTTIDVRNFVPAGWESLELSGQFDVDAVLSSAGAPAAGATLQWYRDGKRIAQSSGVSVFTDRLVLGKHEYYAEFWSAEGYYARSNTVTGSMKSCVTRIAPFDRGDWLDLRLSANSGSVQSFTYSRTKALRHVQGASLPTLELSEFTDRSGSYECAFKDTENAAAFEALRGRMVIIKSRGGNVLIGALTDFSKRYTDFYIAFSFSVQESDWEDFRYVGES